MKLWTLSTVVIAVVSVVVSSCDLMSWTICNIEVTIHIKASVYNCLHLNINIEETSNILKFSDFGVQPAVDIP